MKIQYGMKAAPISIEQLNDRIKKFAMLGMSSVIELHLLGETDIFNKNGLKICIQNCESIKPYQPEFIVHFPHQDISGKIFDPFVDGDETVLKALDFSSSISATAIVMHRYYCLDRNLSFDEAEQLFNQRLKGWADEARQRNLSILVENNGFLWLPTHFNKEYAVTALDHFFPWEIRRFNAFLEAEGISNVFPVIDTAHATLSINMLKLWYRFREFRGDKRFANITMAEEKESPSLTIDDFIKETHSPYLHVSDSILFGEEDKYSKNIDIYLMSEGLSLGRGNIDFDGIMNTVLDNKIDTTLILEIDPIDGNQNNNLAQFEGIKTLKSIKERIIKGNQEECLVS
jgi:sugar phosphate isomerase/epimerase